VPRLIVLFIALMIALSACQSQGGVLPELVQPGKLQGHVSIGPVTPVERVGVSTPTVSPEVYAARQIVIYKQDGKTEITRPKLDASGNYTVTLAPGVYVVGMLRNGLDRATGLPATITIESNKTITVDVAVDTGIR
jgi:hypothetical protein